jgi:hypothetical protein
VCMKTFNVVGVVIGGARVHDPRTALVESGSRGGVAGAGDIGLIPLIEPVTTC